MATLAEMIKSAKYLDKDTIRKIIRSHVGIQLPDEDVSALDLAAFTGDVAGAENVTRNFPLNTFFVDPTPATKRRCKEGFISDYFNMIPEFWAGWAIPVEKYSPVVEDLYINEYTKNLMIRKNDSLISLYSQLHKRTIEVPVNTTTNYMGIFNNDTHQLGWFTLQANNRRNISMSIAIALGTEGTNTKKHVFTEADDPDLYWPLMYNLVSNIVSKFKKPIAKHGSFELYGIDLYTLLIVLRFLRCPEEENLNFKTNILKKILSSGGVSQIRNCLIFLVKPTKMLYNNVLFMDKFRLHKSRYSEDDLWDLTEKNMIGENNKNFIDYKKFYRMQRKPEDIIIDIEGKGYY